MGRAGEMSFDKKGPAACKPAITKLSGTLFACVINCCVCFRTPCYAVLLYLCGYNDPNSPQGLFSVSLDSILNLMKKAIEEECV